MRKLKLGGGWGDGVAGSGGWSKPAQVTADGTAELGFRSCALRICSRMPPELVAWDLSAFATTTRRRCKTHPYGTVDAVLMELPLQCVMAFWGSSVYQPMFRQVPAGAPGRHHSTDLVYDAGPCFCLSKPSLSSVALGTSLPIPRVILSKRLGRSTWHHRMFQISDFVLRTS